MNNCPPVQHCLHPISGSRLNSLTALYSKITHDYSFLHLKDLLSYFSKLSTQYKCLKVAQVFSNSICHLRSISRVSSRDPQAPLNPAVLAGKYISRHSPLVLSLFKMAAGKYRRSFVFKKNLFFFSI